MKPIRLVISGLNSFKEQQEIDFAHLCQGNVFGIFGPTGSGKSTIIDAITLALYGSVKRAARKTQGIVNKAVNEASVLFEFQLGSAGARKHYRVERKYVAKDESVNCRLARLSEVHGEESLVLADKPSQVDQAVQEILGLTEDDFTRAVVLPQGHFAEFLNLQGSERRRMLERIFGLEEYGERLNKVVSERLKATETDLQGIERSQAMLGDATSAAVEGAQKLVETAQAELAQSKTRNETLRGEKDRWGRVRERQQELEQIEIALTQLQQQADLIRDLETKLERHKAAQRIAGPLQAFDQAEERVRQTAAILEQLLAQLATAKKTEIECQQAAEQALQAKQEQEEPLLQKIEQLERALTLEQQVAKLQQELLNKAAAGQALSQQLQATEQEQAALQERMSQVEAELRNWQQEREAKRISPEQREQLTAAMAKQEGYQLVEKQMQATAAEISTREKELERRQEELTQAQEQLVLYKTAEAEQQQLLNELIAQAPPSVSSEQLATANGYLGDAQQLAQDGGRLEQQQTTVTSLEKTISELEAQRIHLLAALQAEEKATQDSSNRVEELEGELARAQEQHMAALLARRLVPGGPCPVCGSHEHPDPNSAIEGDLVQELTENLAEARTARDRQRDKYAAAQAAFTSLEAELERQQQALAKGHEELQIWSARVEEQLSKFPAHWVAKADWTSIPSLAQSHLAQLSEQFSQRSAWQAEVDNRRASLEAAAQRTRQQKQQVELLQQALDNQREELEKLRCRQQELSSDAEQRKGEVARHLAALGETDLATASSRFQELDSRLSELESLIKEQQKMQEGLSQQARQAEQTISQLKEQLAEARMDYQVHQGQLKNLQEELWALTGGKEAAALQQEARSTLADLRQKATTTQANYEQAREQLTALQQKVSGAEEAARLAREEQGQAASRLASALQQEQFVTRGAAEEALGWADLVGQWQVTIDDYKQQKDRLQARSRELQEQLAGQTIAEADWQALVQKAQEAEEQHLRAVEALASAQTDLANVSQRHQQWQELEEEREQLAKDRNLLTELASLLRGNALVEFMAGEHLNAIAGIASDWLALLTSRRYALEVAPDGGFLIRDDGNGGSLRPVATLSGGETFVTSLALALALSSQIQLRGKHRLEFFFLDEGFGSLDPDLLETVMSCLERMQGQAMTVGIISHVPELRERVMCQVLVTPAQPGGRGSRVQVITS